MIFNIPKDFLSQDTFDPGPYLLCSSFGPKGGGWTGYISRKGNLHKNPSLSSNFCQWLCLAVRKKTRWLLRNEETFTEIRCSLLQCLFIRIRSLNLDPETNTLQPRSQGLSSYQPPRSPQEAVRRETLRTRLIPFWMLTDDLQRFLSQKPFTHNQPSVHTHRHNRSENNTTHVKKMLINKLFA